MDTRLGVLMGFPQAWSGITESDTELWTRGTVETAGLRVILDKIRAGSSWVTITGSPGEGKTTLGYLVLRALQKKMKVYKVKTIPEFDEVTRTASHVVLLDDLFGQTKFLEDDWQTWRESFDRFLKLAEVKPFSERGIVLMIGRDFVLKSGFRQTDSHCELLTGSNYVVNVSSGVVRDRREKFNIWNSIAKRYGVNLDPGIVENICNITTCHGFPHSCKLFATLYQINTRISAVEFFHRPLQFLEKTLKVLITDEVIEDIFILIIKGDGFVSRSQIMKCGSTHTRKANDLCTYLKPTVDGYQFDHASIQDAVAILLCETHPQLILERCSIEFVMERVWLITPDEVRRGEATERPWLMVNLPWDNAMVLAARFLEEIEEGNLLRVRRHNAWDSEMFVKMVVESMTAAQLAARDKILGLSLLETINMRFQKCRT